MSTFSLRRGETRAIQWILKDSAGAALNLTGLSVTLAIDAQGRGVRTSKSATIDTPASLGTCVTTFVPSDYSLLKPGAYDFCLWVHGATEVPMYIGVFDVIDVPQRS
jgi:hypothetical protein